jgi:hypothetical protein
MHALARVKVNSRKSAGSDVQTEDEWDLRPRSLLDLCHLGS